MLGVCLGHQALAAAFGGRGGARRARARQDRRGRARRPDDLRRPRHHRSRPGATTRSIVDPELPDDARGSAHSGDTVMAIRHRELPAEGVQFHPESVLTGEGKRLLENFLGR